MAAAPEAWLRGPIPGIDPMLMPAAHALVQASDDLARAASDLSVAELWAKPGGAASVGFHLKHVCGSLGRLLTYARGRALDPAQMRELAAEGQPGDPPADAATLVGAAQRAIADALEGLRNTPMARRSAPSPMRWRGSGTPRRRICSPLAQWGGRPCRRA